MVSGFTLVRRAPLQQNGFKGAIEENRPAPCAAILIHCSVRDWAQLMQKYPDSPVHTLSDSLQMYFFHPDRFAVEFAGYVCKEAVSGKKNKSEYVWTGPTTHTAWKRVNYRGKLTVWSWSLVRSSGFELSSCLTSLLIITCWWNQRKSKPIRAWKPVTKFYLLFVLQLFDFAEGFTKKSYLPFALF